MSEDPELEALRRIARIARATCIHTARKGTRATPDHPCTPDCLRCAADRVRLPEDRKDHTR